MLNLSGEVSLGDFGKLSFNRGILNRIRTRFNDIEVSTALLPTEEYETMILNAGGKRVDLIIGRNSALGKALQTHFDYFEQLVALAHMAPDPDLRLIRSGELKKKYPNEFVAIYKGKVLAHSNILEELSERNYGNINPLFYYTGNECD